MCKKWTIIILICLPCSCQLLNRDAPHSQLARLYYTNTDGEEGVTIFSYHREGIIDKAIWHLTDHSRSSINFYTYNDSGRLALKAREFSDGLTSRIIYHYDERGFLVREDFERSDSVSGVVRYEYDDTGRRSRAECKGLNGWFYGTIRYHHDVNRILRADIVRNGEKAGGISYVYGSRGDLLREEWTLGEGWTQTFRYEYDQYYGQPDTYSLPNSYQTDHKERPSGEQYDFCGKTGGPSWYHYDQNGKLAKKHFIRSDGLQTKAFFLYNTRGYLTHSYRQYSSGLTAVLSFRYNENGRLSERQMKRSDGVTGGRYYSYDKQDRLESAEYQNADGWLTGSILFSHDSEGRAVLGQFNGDKGDKAMISITRTAKGNPAVIHWAFLSGITQTYTYLYEN